MKLVILTLTAWLTYSPNLAAETGAFYEYEKYQPDRYGDLWRPLSSFLIPGFDQLISGHYGSGLAYGGLFLLGQEWNHRARERVDRFQRTDLYQSASNKEKNNFRNLRSIYKESTFSGQVSLVARGLSAYHAFRSNVADQKLKGAYQFLPEYHIQDPSDIASAAFNFSYLKRPSTFIPLGLILGFALLDHYNKPQSAEVGPFNLSDAGYTIGLSFNAGTNEEAIFRGWLMPIAMEYTNSPFLANVIQSTIFAAAHAPQTPVPIVQLGLGYYLGYLTLQNNWSIEESIFIHTWWDIFAFAIQFSTKEVETDGIWLPPLRLRF